MAGRGIDGHWQASGADTSDVNGAEVDARAKGRRSHRRRECYRIQKESSAIGYWMIIASGRDRCSEVSERTSGVHVPVDVV